MPYTETTAEQNAHNTRYETLQQSSPVVIIKDRHEGIINYKNKHSDRG